MNNESISFEEQFAAFSGQSPQWPPATDEPAVSLVPAPAPSPEQTPPATDPFTPTSAVEQHVAPAAEPAQAVTTAAEPSTDVLLAELDKATRSLAMFREEIGRVVGHQRTTEAELVAARGQLAHLEGQVRESAEFARLESELARQRDVVATVRAKLAELVSSLDAS